jgi:hypothetical protein
MSAQRTPASLGLTSFGLYTFSLVCILAFRTAKMPMIIWGPVLANEPLSAAFTSANFWHLKKPPKIKQSKAAFLQGWGREKGHPSPRPSSRLVAVRSCPSGPKRGPRRTMNCCQRARGFSNAPFDRRGSRNVPCAPAFHRLSRPMSSNGVLQAQSAQN